MVVAVADRLPADPQYIGLRLTADEYFTLEDDGFRYELINGVMVMSPSPMPDHSDVLGEFEFQVRTFLRRSPVGRVFQEIDWRAGPDLVYRPDLMFFLAERAPSTRKRIAAPPDFILEVLSPGSVSLDRRTKKDDYERLGVREYWIVDSRRRAIEIHRLIGGRYAASEAAGERVESQSIPGFVLDAKALWAAAEG